MTCNLSTDTSTQRHFTRTLFLGYKFSCTYLENYNNGGMYLFWVLHSYILKKGMDVRACMNSTCIQICFPSIVRTSVFFLLVTIMCLMFLIRKVKGFNNFTCVQIRIAIFVYKSLFRFIYLTKNLILLPWMYTDHGF